MNPGVLDGAVKKTVFVVTMGYSVDRLANVPVIIVTQWSDV